MDKGKLLEALVAELEMAIDRDVTLTARDRVPGRTSGKRREVDVTLRRLVGSTEVLVMVECRDRARPQGVEWIDDLVGKAADVQAAKVVAVSRSGFTPSARRRAEAAGIELRTVASVAADDVARWFALRVSVGIFRATLRQVVGITADERGFAERADSMDALLFPNQHRPMIRLPGLTELISVDQLLRESLPQALQAQPPADGSPAPCCFSFTASGPPIEIVTETGMIELRLLELGVDVVREDRPLSPALMEQYRDEVGVLSQLAVYAVAQPDELWTVTVREAPPLGERYLLPLRGHEGGCESADARAGVTGPSAPKPSP